ncbi:CDP-alcohol phosphatidyltransferase family protein [Bisgaard Taxon 10/6]|uniref:CDP-alcohol phosphatidyltransferase family protein n=1 Tax=Exercitatus varius TaxID=67857 RepID=UPI00294AE5EF|nr:CDP-alcohol phosphatidyltransferase family protein [Exercitatus varius]MDG2956252.1 CDP-alcohol phosphatidyltransferase family protein [Exercitatus varius]MDG2964368.1 CDP-alcohol phosphatidyltransferase family protein [Exercitatus varius]
MNYIEQYRDLRDKTMTPEKYESAKQDYFAFYIGRPLSYWLTIPFLKTSLTPNQVSYISIIPIFIGFLLMTFFESKSMLMLGWFMFFLWNLLDGVDGNLARYRKQFSKDGSVIDAMAGYASMAFTFLSAGVAASNYDNLSLESKYFIILGALSSISLIFPRLVMHKYINSVGTDTASESVKDKKTFSPLKILALNLTSITGLPQVFLFIAILTTTLDYLTVIYFVINIAIMFASLHSLLRKK